jgi:two-component system, OmpR family, response regulator
VTAQDHAPERQACSSVLLVQRDLSNRLAIEQALLQEGLGAVVARGQREAQAALISRSICLIILSPRLAPDDGWQVFRQLRSSGLPIVVLVPDGDPELMRLALALGADDCFSDRASPVEIATRVRFGLKRAPLRPALQPSFGSLVLEPGLGARLSDRLIPLTRTEYAVLESLVEAQGRVVTREQLVARARAQAGSFPLARSIDSHVRSLRQKLGDDPDQPRLLRSVRGLGYQLARSPAEPLTLADAVLQALSEPILVVDDRQQVKLMNRAAEQLARRPAQQAVDTLSCRAILACQVPDDECRTCPWVAVRTSGSPTSARLTIAPADEPLRVQCSAQQLAGSDRVLLRFSEATS